MLQLPFLFCLSKPVKQMQNEKRGGWGGLKRGKMEKGRWMMETFCTNTETHTQAKRKRRRETEREKPPLCNRNGEFRMGAKWEGDKDRDRDSRYVSDSRKKKW